MKVSIKKDPRSRKGLNLTILDLIFPNRKGSGPSNHSPVRC